MGICTHIASISYKHTCETRPTVDRGEGGEGRGDLSRRSQASTSAWHSDESASGLGMPPTDRLPRRRATTFPQCDSDYLRRRLRATALTSDSAGSSSNPRHRAPAPQRVPCSQRCAPLLGSQVVARACQHKLTAGTVHATQPYP